MNKYYFSLLLLFTVLLLGCGKNRCIPFGGKVTYDDGSPITMGIVNFSNDHFMARGKIAPNGTWTLDSYKEGDGIPPGNYKVSISGVVRTDVTNGKETVVSLIDPNYTDAQTTPLLCEVVKGGEKTFDFTVPKNAKLK